MTNNMKEHATYAGFWQACEQTCGTLRLGLGTLLGLLDLALTLALLELERTGTGTLDADKCRCMPNGIGLRNSKAEHTLFQENPLRFCC